MSLSDVCTKASSGFVQKDLEELEGEYPVYGASGYIKSINQYHQEKEYIAVVKDGAGIGRTMILPAKSSIIGTMQYLLPKENILPRYLYYAVKNMHLEKYYTGATIPHIYFKDYQKEKFNLPDIYKQNEVVEVLEIIEKITEKRNAQLNDLDTLIKARFVEMFGDPIHNDKGWDTDSVSAVCADIYGGGTPSKAHPEYYENGDIPWVSSKDMKTDVITESQIYINQLGVDNSSAKMVPINSVIMVIRSGILKHTLPVAINAVPITVNQDLKVFIPNNRILTRFLAIQFKMHEADILTGVRAVTADNIEFETLKTRSIIVPPIELQQEYIDFVIQIDKLKVAVQESLDELQTLFDSLMQQYFG